MSPGGPVRAVGFAPVRPAATRLLVLGSLPGAASLRASQYYAHPRNAFWPILARLLGFDPSLPYEQRLSLLANSGIALWDVGHSAVRTGSLDSAIDARSLVANDVGGLIAELPDLAALAFNGAKAAALFRKHVLPGLEPAAAALPRYQLPSTSPANASLSFERKLAAWSVLTRYLPDQRQ
jgi:double-stranded uracil-DNA glycosylase